MPLFLVIDTSSETGVVALFNGSELLRERTLPHGLRNSRSLLPTLDTLFHELGLAPQDLSFVAVGVGPGSYTGIRVGAVVAKMIHMTCRIPLVPVISLKGLVPDSDGPFLSVLDARIAGVYALAGSKDHETIAWEGEPQVLSQIPGDCCLVVTPHEQIKTKLNWKGNLEIKKPSGKWLGLAALEGYHAENFAEQGQLDILYLRKTQAEREASEP